MKILILGGTGVVGSGIQAILSKKHFIYSLNSKIYNRKNSEYLINKKIKFDLFIHAAGVTDEEIKKYGNISSLKRSTKALNKLVNYLLINKCTNFVYISSQRVYSNFYKPTVAIFDEDKSKVKATTIYEKCHLESENIYKKVSRIKNCKVLIIRPGAVYGFSKHKNKNSRPDLIQHSFPNSLIKNNKIILKSSGKQFRNFSYNEDIGKIVSNWLIQNKKQKLLITNVKGLIITVLSFAQRCCAIYKQLNKKKTRIIVLNKQKQKFKKFKITQKIEFKSNSSSNLKKFIIKFIKLSLKKKYK